MSINSMSSIQSLVNKSKVQSVSVTPASGAIIQYVFNNNLTNYGSAGTAYNGINNNLTFSTTNPSPSTNTASIVSTNGGTTNYQYFKIPAMSSIINTSNGVTVTFWWSPRGNVSGDAGLACFGSGATGTQYASGGGNPVATLHCNTASSQMQVSMSFAPTANNSSKMNFNTWHHLALIMDLVGTTPTYSLYIDNVNIASNLSYPSIDGYNYYPTVSDFWTIGTIINSHGWGQFNGAISDFRIYNSKLSSANVSSIYNNTL